MVCGSGVSTASTFSPAVPSKIGRQLQLSVAQRRSQLHFTSAEVTGLPLWNSAPLRSLKS